MSAAVAAASMSPLSLAFARSESKPVGFSGSMMDQIRDNAPRIVGALKLLGDVTAAMTLNPYLMAYAAFSITGRGILMAYGSKKNQQQVAAEHAQDGKTFETSKSWIDDVKKIGQKREYPVESSAAFSTVGEMFEAAYGATELWAGRPGITPLLVGIVAVGAYGNILFGKEKKKSKPEHKPAKPLQFATSESKLVGAIDQGTEYLKDNPVLTSSLIGLVICAGLLTGSIMEGMNPTYIAYAVIATVATTVQALFIRKNEFNIEGAQDDARKAESSFQDRVTKTRGNETGMAGIQPA